VEDPGPPCQWEVQPVGPRLPLCHRCGKAASGRGKHGGRGVRVGAQGAQGAGRERRVEAETLGAGEETTRPTDAPLAAPSDEEYGGLRFLLFFPVPLVCDFLGAHHVFWEQASVEGKGEPATSRRVRATDRKRTAHTFAMICLGHMRIMIKRRKKSVRFLGDAGDEGVVFELHTLSRCLVNTGFLHTCEETKKSCCTTLFPIGRPSQPRVVPGAHPCTHGVAQLWLLAYIILRGRAAFFFFLFSFFFGHFFSNDLYRSRREYVTMQSPFPVPQSAHGGSLQAPVCPPPKACPEKE